MAYAFGFPKNVTDMIYELREWMPRRPRHCHHSRPGMNDFLMDFENSLLEDWDARKGIPTGPRRFENAEWAELVKRNVYPNHPDVDWDEYVDWVSSGGGDEWFVASVEGDERSSI